MKDSTKEALFKFGEFCDSGKPWYCFFGVYLVTLIVNITLLLTSEQTQVVERGPRRVRSGADGVEYCQDRDDAERPA